MSDHYYSMDPGSNHDLKVIEDQINNRRFRFQTDSGVFSKGSFDYGSKVIVKAFIEAFPNMKQARILELGSGYGPIAISLASFYPKSQVTGIEINQRAFQLAEVNQTLNQVNNISWIHGDVTASDFKLENTYEFVVTNPPIRAGKAVIQHFVDFAYDHLDPQGKLLVVIQKKQGAPSMRKHMEAVFGNVDRLALDKGYWVLVSEKEN
ncbi:class I SAM-dependent methyltransferase [Hutsoniella sourekii]